MFRQKAKYIDISCIFLLPRGASAKIQKNPSVFRKGPTRSRSNGQNSGSIEKNPVIRNTHAKYESPNSEGAEVTANVEVFADEHTDRQTMSNSGRDEQMYIHVY